jgi:hypothetical protein
MTGNSLHKQWPKKIGRFVSVAKKLWLFFVGKRIASTLAKSTSRVKVMVMSEVGSNVMSHGSDGNLES